MRAAGRFVGWTVALAAGAAVVTGCSSGAHHSAGPSPVPTAPATVSAPPPADPAVEAARTGVLKVVDDYERAGAAVKSGKPKKADPGGTVQYFATPAAAARFQGDGSTGAPIGCGASGGKGVVDGAIVGTPVPGSGTITVPVSLYVGTSAAARLTVTTDASGKLTDFACGPAADPGLPGTAALVGYYGGAAAAAGAPDSDETVTGLKQKFLTPGFAAFTRPGLDADQSTCGDDGGLPYWHAVYAPSATRTGAQWYFWPGSDGQVVMSVAVDRSPRVAWVYCVGQLPPPPAPGSYSDDQVQSYVGELFNQYSYLLALKPFGADQSAMADYFASPAAYRAALAGTGGQPLECSSTLAGSISADGVQVTGGTAVVSLSSAPTTHGLQAGETALGHPKATVDTATMKITSVSCG